MLEMIIGLYKKSQRRNQLRGNQKEDPNMVVRVKNNIRVFNFKTTLRHTVLSLCDTTSKHLITLHYTTGLRTTAHMTIAHRAYR